MSRSVVFTDDQIVQIVALHTGPSRKGTKSIGELLGVSPTPILRVLRERGVLREKHALQIPFTPDQIDDIVKLYTSAGRPSMADIAEIYGVSQYPIYRLLIERRLVKKSGHAALYPIVDGKKQCRTCNKWKLISAFSRDNHSYRSDCNGCRSDQRKHENRFRTYGLTREEYEKRTKEQNGVCMICGRPEQINLKGGRVRNALAVDHDHTTGQIRDLLCSWCNRAIGFLADDPERAEAVAAYLRKWKERNADWKR